MNTPGLILLVEDNDNDVLLTLLALEKAGVTNPHRSTKSAEEAVAYLKGLGRYAHREQFPLPVLIILDLSLPGLNGFELIRWVRSQAELDPVHIAVLTGSSDPRDADHAHQLGADFFLKKPLVRETISVFAPAFAQPVFERERE